MKKQSGKRVLSLVLALCLVLGMIPVLAPVQAEAVGGIGDLTCASFISNTGHRDYIDTMMKHYLNTQSKLRTALDNGKNVIFMFEGGSDNYPSNTYEDSAYDTRNQAVCIVVKKNSAGNAYIAFYSENCSSIPDDPDNCTGAAYSGATTLMDGIYGVQTTNHIGPYGALNTYATTGYYTPPGDQNGYVNGASGINIHTRTSAGSGGGWSLGCQVIGSGNSSSNEFNAFMKTVTGITYNVWVNFSSALYTLSGSDLYKDVGYYVIDRQLGCENAGGTYYGSGSLIQMYNSTALTNITAWSTAQRAEADPSAYLKRCTVYPSHCKLTTTKSTPLNTLPCSASSSYGSQTLVTAEAGQTYTAKALYLNTSDNYWYQITLDTGETAYLYGGHASLVESVGTDITVSDAAAPGHLNEGAGFSVSGKVTSTLNRLDEVEVGIYTGSSLLGAPVTAATVSVGNNTCELDSASLDFAALEAGSYFYSITAKYSGYYATSSKEVTTYSDQISLLGVAFTVGECEHSFTTKVIQAVSCTVAGILEQTCTKCALVSRCTVAAPGHRYAATVVSATCTEAGGTQYTCLDCGDSFLDATVPATGHSYDRGSCTACGAVDPDYTSGLTQPTLTLKSPTLEFKDMICITAFYTAENIQDVVEMGMITYDEKVATWSVDTADYVIPGATYVESTGRYYSSSQGLHAKHLGDTVYLAVYAKLFDGSYAYSKLAGYSAVQYATSQLKNSTDVNLKKLVAAMLNYGTEAQLYFGHKTDTLANASLTADQKALPDTYRADMITAVPAAPADKQGIFANNSGFASRKPAISFEGAFCINYFFAPQYTPDSGITLYYWNAEDYNTATVLTVSNATGKFKLEGSGTGEYRGDITGISAKALSEAVYVACAYKSGGTVWTSGVLGYSIGAYCSSQASKANSISNLAMATAIYGYHAKQYFG